MMVPVYFLTEVKVYLLKSLENAYTVNEKKLYVLIFSRVIHKAANRQNLIVIPHSMITDGRKMSN